MPATLAATIAARAVVIGTAWHVYSHSDDPRWPLVAGTVLACATAVHSWRRRRADRHDKALLLGALVAARPAAKTARRDLSSPAPPARRGPRHARQG